MLIDMNGVRLPLLATIKAVTCIKIDIKPWLFIFWISVKYSIRGFYVYLNTGNGFDSGKQWQSDFGIGDSGNWKNLLTHENMGWAVFPIFITT
jgi:hypothetical protein